uniref:Uncharacterized protein n=1 Tax=Rangifer tarandus platyrhynchus TaxID=3082113 RepID=A0ACB0E2F5_RANTA|nr:unnamed protein product [Rangifer tarandus platyrhynchus]
MAHMRSAGDQYGKAKKRTAGHEVSKETRWYPACTPARTPSVAAHCESRGEGSITVPSNRSPPLSTPDTREPSGRDGRESRAEGEFEAHPRFNEVKDDVIAKSHPAESDARGAGPEPPEGTRGPDNGRTDAAGGVDPRRSTERVLAEHGGQQVGTAGRGRHRAEIRRGEGRGAAGGRRRRGAPTPRRAVGAGGNRGCSSAEDALGGGGAGSPAEGTCLPAAPRDGDEGRRSPQTPPAAERGSQRRGCRDGELDGAFCGQEARSPAVTGGLAVTPRPPSPPHPFRSSNIGPKSVEPTTTNRRHRFGNQWVGARVEGGGRHKGEGTPRGTARAVLEPNLGSRRALRGGLGSARAGTSRPISDQPREGGRGSWTEV